MNTQDILDGTLFTLEGNPNMKFYLEFQKNWNNYGYRTWFSLHLYIPQSKYPFKIADLSIFNKGQKKGDIPYWDPKS